MNMELWERAVEIHGHECAGLAYGFRMGEEVKKIFNAGERVFSIMPRRNCVTDGVAIVTGIRPEDIKIDPECENYIFYAEGDDEGWKFIQQKLEMAEGADPVTGILAYNRDKLYTIVPCDL